MTTGSARIFITNVSHNRACYDTLSLK